MAMSFFAACTLVILSGFLYWLKGLHDLEITASKRKELIKALKVQDYSKGPLEEKMRSILPMWVFGIEVKKKEVYIKISMGIENTSAICISFHIAEYPMKYPYIKVKS